MQWDFGQPGRGEKADELLGLYQQSMPENQRFNEQELTSLSTRLRTRGQTDNALTQEEKSKLDTFLRSDDGRLFVGELNQSQVARKWQNVGRPLSEINWLNELGRTNPTEAAEIIAVTSKLYNQNEIRGQRLIDHLEMHELTSTQTRTYLKIVLARQSWLRVAQNRGNSQHRIPNV